MPSRILRLLFVPLLLAPGVAHADEEPEELQSYGAQILLIDAIASMTLIPGFIAAVNRSPAPEVYLGAAVYALGGPTVHLFHRQHERAIGSFVLRLMPMAGFLVLANAREPADRGRDPRCVGTGTHTPASCDSDAYGRQATSGLGQIAGLVLVGLGMMGVTAIDAAALAKEPVVRVKPTASLGASSGTIGLQGSF